EAFPFFRLPAGADAPAAGVSRLASLRLAVGAARPAAVGAGAAGRARAHPHQRPPGHRALAADPPASGAPPARRSLADPLDRLLAGQHALRGPAAPLEPLLALRRRID